jgi:NAD(P)H-hydrate repair Nnr-like enzyme with NAD(P)H-hydrate dehydratase domain
MAASSLAAMILIICPWFGGFMPGAQAAESAALRGADLVMVAALSNYLNQVRAVAPDYIADALDHYNRDLNDRPFPRAEGVKIALELTAQ